MAVNLASKYAKQVDERFSKASQAQLALNNQYSFTGVKTVNVYSIPTVPLTNYTRSGTSRYGTPAELQDSVQELTVTRDRSYAFTIDKGNKVQQQMVKDAGQAYARELREVVIPEFDRYVFWKLASAAAGNSRTATTAPTKSNAYELFLNAQEALGDACVPDSGRVCFCSYKFANLLKQDPAFMKEGDRSKSMIDRGVMGQVDGTRIVKVPASRLPTGAAFILTHPVAACAPKQLWEHKIHTDPPGISGWLVEGRVLYDCFVLNEKRDAIWYHGTAPAETFS
ncbi:MAG: N4-gp56 family major capsid protein [Oscillibacter sp.]|nr:N4-gp56 family major capsid protein [Oscillibacter sp.]